MKNHAVAIDKLIKNLNLSKIKYLYPERITFFRNDVRHTISTLTGWVLIKKKSHFDRLKEEIC